MVPDSTGRYIGVPFVEHGRQRDGWDCYGLLACYYREQFGITLPSYADEYQSTTDAEEIGALIAGEAWKDWTEIQVSEARWGDALLIRMRGQPMHVGVVVSPPYFLHCAQGIGTVMERWDRPLWERRVVGCYRHRDR